MIAGVLRTVALTKFSSVEFSENPEDAPPKVRSSRVRESSLVSNLRGEVEERMLRPRHSPLGGLKLLTTLTLSSGQGSLSTHRDGRVAKILSTLRVSLFKCCVSDSIDRFASVALLEFRISILRSKSGLEIRSKNSIFSGSSSLAQKSKDSY